MWFLVHSAVSWIRRYVQFYKLTISVNKHPFSLHLQSEKEKEIIFATNACSRIFCEFLDRGDLYVGELPKEEDLMRGKILFVFVICLTKGYVKLMSDFQVFGQTLFFQVISVLK